MSIRMNRRQTLAAMAASATLPFFPRTARADTNYIESQDGVLNGFRITDFATQGLLTGSVPVRTPVTDPVTGDTAFVAHYEYGDPNGPPLVLAHGNPDSSLIYRNWVSLLQRFHIYIPDLIGFGSSSKPSDRSLVDVGKLTNMMGQWVGSLGLPPGAALFAADYGVIVFLRLLAQNPSLFSNVVIGNSALPTGTTQELDALASLESEDTLLNVTNGLSIAEFSLRKWQGNDDGRGSGFERGISTQLGNASPYTPGLVLLGDSFGLFNVPADDYYDLVIAYIEAFFNYIPVNNGDNAPFSDSSVGLGNYAPNLALLSSALQLPQLIPYAHGGERRFPDQVNIDTLVALQQNYTGSFVTAFTDQDNVSHNWWSLFQNGIPGVYGSDGTPFTGIIQARGGLSRVFLPTDGDSPTEQPSDPNVRGAARYAGHFLQEQWKVPLTNIINQLVLGS